MCKVQDDPAIDRMLPDSDVLLSLPFRQPPRQQNIRYQSHPVVENEDVRMPCGNRNLSILSVLIIIYLILKIQEKLSLAVNVCAVISGS